jgi:transposase
LKFEELQNQGYCGGYDSVRRYVKRWRRQQQHMAAQVFIPLRFDPAEAFQFDWSHESVQIDGMPVKAKAAHLRLCHSRMFLVVAYPRETQEMVFDAHMRAFEFFGGVCRKGIYDNLKAVVRARNATSTTALHNCVRIIYLSPSPAHRRPVGKRGRWKIRLAWCGDGFLHLV